MWGRAGLIGINRNISDIFANRKYFCPSARKANEDRPCRRASQRSGLMGEIINLPLHMCACARLSSPVWFAFSRVQPTDLNSRGPGSETRFLDASSHLYKRVCLSVGPSVHRSIGRSVGRLVRNHLFSKSKNEGLSFCISSGKPTNIAEM